MPLICKCSFLTCPFEVALPRLYSWSSPCFGAFGAALASLAPLTTRPSAAGNPSKPDPADVEFFEKKVRPILAARCQGCHGPDKQKGGLRLDARATVLAGGSTGPAVVPGNPKESLLVDAINYGETYQMPPKSKLPPEEIATLTEWVARGAPWGIATAASAESPATARIPGALSKAEFEARARYWSFQPLEHVSPPSVKPAHVRLGAQPDRPLHPGRARSKRT